MVVITLDTESIGGITAGLATAAIGIYRYLKSKGYVEIWKRKLTLNLDVVDAAHKQNGHALTKLNMSDDLVRYLQVLAPGENGKIDEEKAIASLRDCIKWNNRLIEKIPYMKDLEHK